MELCVDARLQPQHRLEVTPPREYPEMLRLFVETANELALRTFD
ncbi:hypothetical protein [Myxococcus sp. CA018]|nr:hypothetical protein [Myxococcus sp. CA018]